MAVPDDAKRFFVSLLCGLTIACAASATLRAESVLTLDAPSTGRDAGAHAWWKDGASRLQDLWVEGRRRVRQAEPDWLRHRSALELNDATETPPADLCLVVQDDRPDGSDLVTARYTLSRAGTLRTYAGAGVHRTQYFRDDGLPGPNYLHKRNRATSMGAAAEVGAEMQVTPRMLVNADVRWAALTDRAEAVRSDYGPVTAEPLMLGVSVGYRFR